MTNQERLERVLKDLYVLETSLQHAGLAVDALEEKVTYSKARHDIEKMRPILRAMYYTIEDAEKDAAKTAACPTCHTQVKKQDIGE